MVVVAPQGLITATGTNNTIAVLVVVCSLAALVVVMAAAASVDIVAQNVKVVADISNCGSASTDDRITTSAVVVIASILVVAVRVCQ